MWGLLLKGLGALTFGPAFGLASGIIDYITGDKSGWSTISTIGLSGFINIGVDLIDFDYYLDNHPSEKLVEASIAVASTIIDQDIISELTNIDYNKSESEINYQEVCVLNMSSNNPKVEGVYKKEINSGIYIPEYNISTYNLDEDIFRSNLKRGILVRGNLN